MNTSLYFFVGRTYPKKEVSTNFGERSGSYFRYKKIMNFQRFYFQCIFNDFSILLDISSKVMNKF